MQRYLKDDVPTQIGGIAANLARVGSFSRNLKNREVVFGLLDESKYFVEWCAPNAEVDQAARLVELQIQLALWQFDWDALWPNSEARQKMAEMSLKWSDEVLELSGLLNTDQA